MTSPRSRSPARPRRRAIQVVLAVAVALLVPAPVSAAAVPATAREASAAAHPDPLWLPPFGAPLIVSGPYRAPPSPYASGHRGIDMPAVPGATVQAPAAGTVTFVGRVVDRDTVTIRADTRTLYSVEPVTSQLTVGDTVAAGSVLGIVASGGHCAAECAHLGVRVDDEYVSPLRYLLGVPVLLPW